MAWKVGVGEMLAVPRFEWISNDEVDDSAPFLNDRDTSTLPGWLVRDRDNDDWLRVPTWVDPAWFAKEAATPLRALAKLEAAKGRGRASVTLSFGYRLLSTDLEAAIEVVRRALGPATGALLSSPPLADPEEIAEWQSTHLAPELDAFDRSGAPHLTLLLYAIGFLQATRSSYAWFEDDHTATSLAELSRRRFFRTVGTRAESRASLDDWTLDLFAELETSDTSAATEELRACIACVNGLAEASHESAAVYLAAAKHHALSGHIEQARTDLAWADHLGEGTYVDPFDAIAENVRGAVELVHSLADRI